MTSPFHPFFHAKPVATMPRVAALLLSLPLAATAGYYQWDMVELPASSGAICGNGSPYRFFVNRTPMTDKTIILFEGGGACYDKAACQYRSGFLGAINPNGIPKDYMTKVLPSIPNTVGTKIGVFNSALKGNITPFASRNSSQKVQTQSWNIVYAPYCTGDVYTGNRVAVYAEADGTAPITYHHKGNVNTEAMVDWLKANMPRPSTLMVTGFSAGGVGATANYAYVRESLNPGKSSLLADSGPLFSAGAGDNRQQSPSKPLHDTIRVAWGIDGEQGIAQKLLRRYPQVQADTSNLGVLNTAVAQVFPQDRLGFTLTQSDKLFASFAYDNFHPEIRAASTIQERDKIRVDLWRKDVANWLPLLQASNVGYYLPYSRDSVLKSHTTTMITFIDTDVPSAGTRSVTDFVDNLIDGQGPVMKVQEGPRNKVTTLSDKFLVWLQDQIFSSLGL
jgi:Pectinacetylesterase